MFNRQRNSHKLIERVQELEHELTKLKSSKFEDVKFDEFDDELCAQ